METQNFTETGFWAKLSQFFSAMGIDLVVIALTLYYIAQSPNTPVWAKTTIYVALAYLICPVDAIPDIMPIIGYTDDAAILTAAALSTSLYVTDEITAKARAKAATWFS